MSDIINLATLAISETEKGTPSDSLLQKLTELFADERIQQAVSELRLKIIDRLQGSHEPLEGIDMLSEHGTFVRDGIRERLEGARSDLNAIGITMFMGGVELFDETGKTIIGQIAIPYKSRWARQSFINTNPLKRVESFTFTPYGASSWINPEGVKEGDEGSAFFLTERQAIAAQILMVINAVIDYRDLTLSALREREDDWNYGAPKVDADLRDLLAAYEYARELREELLHMPMFDPRKDMTALMSAAASVQQLLS